MASDAADTTDRADERRVHAVLSLDAELQVDPALSEADLAARVLDALEGDDGVDVEFACTTTNRR